MKKVILTSSPAKYEHLKSCSQIIDVTTFKDEIPAEWNNYASEYTPFKICESIKGENLRVAIDFLITEDFKYLLAHHIISTYSDAVIFFFTEDKSQIKLHLENDYGLFRNKAIKCLSIVELREIFLKDEELTRISNIFDSEFDYKNYYKIYQSLITFDRHQISNEWGAIRLLLNHGITILKIKSTYNIPETIYFKQKLREDQIKENVTIDFSAYPKKADIVVQKKLLATKIASIQNILLIDDNAERGWEYALSTFFPSANVDTKFNVDETNSIVDFSIYDLIFLDLRLPINSATRLTNLNNGLQLIKKIKNDQNSLHVPLIIFTASEKASTLDQIIEYGADAMYIKDSTKHTNEESFDNYLDFIKKLNFQIDKGKELKKYWVANQVIKASFLSEIVDSGSLLYKSRIIERLEMFYGLIKTKYEQSQYNKDSFHYSSDILSFMTLWSILNEIQEAYFEKTFSNVTLPLASGPLLRADHSIFTYLSKWNIKNQSNDVYFEKINVGLKLLANGAFKMKSNGDYDITTDLEFYFEYNPANSPAYKTRRTNGRYIKSRINQPDQKLSFQIAFILLEKNQLKTAVNLQQFLDILKGSNDQRNKLYLTHGEDSTTSFYAMLEKNKTLLSNSKENLFKLVGFLLTGNENIV